MRAISFILSLLLVPVLIAGCCCNPCDVGCDAPPEDIEGPPDHTDPETPAEEMLEVFSEDDTGRKVTVDVGDRFKVRLIGRPGTGYGWRRVPAADTRLELVGKPTSKALNPGLAGGKAEIVFTFAATGAGSETLTLEYVQGWHEGAKSGATFTLEVLVK